MVTVRHWRLEVVVFDTSSNWAGVHEVTALHVRSVLVVGWLDSNWKTVEQTV